MNRRYCAIFYTMLIMQAISAQDDTNYSKIDPNTVSQNRRNELFPEQSSLLDRYIARTQEKEYIATMPAMQKIRETAQSMGTGALTFGLMGMLAGMPLQGFAAGAFTGLSGRLYQYYNSNMPTISKKNLSDLQNYINEDTNNRNNYVMIGGNRYLLAKAFHDTKNTGYSPQPSIFTMDPATPYNHYEIYVMPNDLHLTDTFTTLITKLTQKTNKTLADSIAFIAIRPTSEIYNSSMPFIRQVLPRIVIVLKNTATKDNAQNIILILNELLKNKTASGYWPRYSEKIPNNVDQTPNLIYVGYGNSDFKSANPSLFERKTWLGIPQPGDMAYPRNPGNLKIQIRPYDFFDATLDWVR